MNVTFSAFFTVLFQINTNNDLNPSFLNFYVKAIKYLAQFFLLKIAKFFIKNLLKSYRKSLFVVIL
jgi:hypothetical protein